MHTQLNTPPGFKPRRLMGASLLAFALLQFGAVGVASAQDTQAPGVAGTSTHTALGPLKHVKAGLLDVAYAEVGPADGPVVILLHGWPYDIDSYSEVAPLLAAQGYRVLVPYARGYGDTHFLSAKTLRKHRDNLWLLGGEIISDLHESPRLRKRPMAQVVFAALNDEGGPLISNRASEEQQRSFDSTCRKLHRFIKEDGCCG